MNGSALVNRGSPRHIRDHNTEIIMNFNYHVKSCERQNFEDEKQRIKNFAMLFLSSRPHLSV